MQACFEIVVAKDISVDAEVVQIYQNWMSFLQ